MRKSLPFVTLCAFLGLFSLFSVNVARAQNNASIYADTLGSGWQNWSWGTTLDFANPSPVHSGSSSIAVTYNYGYVGLYLSFPARLDTRLYSTLTFYINGGNTSNHNIAVVAVRNQNFGSSAFLTGSYIENGSIGANQWRKVTIPLSAIAASGVTDFSGICIQEQSGSPQSTFYVDDIQLISIAPPSLVNVNVRSAYPSRTVDSRTFGMNTAVWDGQVDSTTTVNLLNEMGAHTLRFPGGSISDGYHWQTGTNHGNPYVWPTNFDNFANTALKMKANVFITVNYGSGTPEEAAAWVQYSNVTKKYGFKYWEIGNELYGSWEYDLNARKNDPYTYAVRAKDYIQQMKAVDPTIKIGVVCDNGEDSWANYTDHPVTNPRTGAVHNGWTPVMLATLKSLGVTPDFLVLHTYAQGPGSETDAGLLQAGSYWPGQAGDLRQQLTDYLGAAGAGVELVCTENNSCSYNPGKQMTSLVNALYYCDSLGSVLQTEFNSVVWWNLRNGQDGSQNNSPFLYGWRNYGDYGIVSPTNEKYPTFYGMKLMTNFAHTGDYVIPATSDYSQLSVYATRQYEDTLKILVINKSPTYSLTARFNLGDATPRKGLSFLSYGIPQDEAQRTGTGNPDLTTSTQAVSANFQHTFAPYSATVITVPIYIRKVR